MSVRVTVLYFAAARERAGTRSEELQLADGATAQDALRAACAAHPQLLAVAEKLRLAVDQRFEGPGAPLRDGAEVALIPPVAGGAPSRHRVRGEAFSPEEAVREVEGPDCGAVVSFVGVVRDRNQGQPVLALEYEVFAPMALKVFAGIEAEAGARWPGARLAIHHREGRLLPGEVSVVIAAAAPHRADAFDACRHAIEALKQDAPIWKRETHPDGSVWVGLGS